MSSHLSCNVRRSRLAHSTSSSHWQRCLSISLSWAGVFQCRLFQWRDVRRSQLTLKLLAMSGDPGLLFQRRLVFPAASFNVISSFCDVRRSRLALSTSSHLLNLFGISLGIPRCMCVSTSSRGVFQHRLIFLAMSGDPGLLFQHRLIFSSSSASPWASPGVNFDVAPSVPGCITFLGNRTPSRFKLHNCPFRLFHLQTPSYS
jgi:hypothetical protein